MAERREEPTQQEQAPANTEQQLAMLCAVVERSPLAMALTVGTTHTLRAASPAFRQFLRSAPPPGSDCLGDRLGAAVWAGVQPLLDRVFASGMAEVAADLDDVDQAWGTRTWTYAVWPVTAPDGCVDGLMLHASETTAQEPTQQRDAQTEQLRAVNEQLLLAGLREQAARDEAEAALRVRDQFLTIASHELRTPLTALLGYAHLLQRQEAGDRVLPAAQRTRYLDMVVRQTQRLSLLVGQLLDVTRIEQGQFVLQRAPLDLGALVARVVDEFGMSLGASATPSPIALSATGEALIINGDAARLEQVVLNLLSNAVKYSPTGSPVAVRVERVGTEAAVAVTDQGIGIPQVAQAHLFDTFYRAPNVGPISGFGVGLHVVASIVARHDGRMTVESTEGQGSTFRIVLPLHMPAD